MFFFNIFSQNIKNSFRRCKGAHIYFELKDKKKCAANYKENNLTGAVVRIQNQLSYRLGFAMIKNSKNINL